MSTLYINCKSQAGLETVDEFDQKEGQSWRDYKKYVARMKDEYNLAFGGGCYISSRACKAWRENKGA